MATNWYNMEVISLKIRIRFVVYILICQIDSMNLQTEEISNYGYVKVSFLYDRYEIQSVAP